MKKTLILFSLLMSAMYYSQMYTDKRLSNFIKDEGILLTVSKVLDFTNSSSTILLNDYSPIFITVDADRLRYTKTNFSDEKLLDGVMNILIDHKMSLLKSALKDLKCYKIDDERYLVFRLGKDLKNNTSLLYDNTTCDCEELYAINADKNYMPQGMISYGVEYDVAFVYDVATFDAIDFLRIHFLENWNQNFKKNE